MICQAARLGGKMQNSNARSQPEIAQRAKSVMQSLCSREMHIGTAESSTGGLVAALLTDIEGMLPCAKAWFRDLYGSIKT